MLAAQAVAAQHRAAVAVLTPAIRATPSTRPDPGDGADNGSDGAMRIAFVNATKRVSVGGGKIRTWSGDPGSPACTLGN